MKEETDSEQTIVTLDGVNKSGGSGKGQDVLSENPFLVIMSGREKGKKILLTRGVTTIGRAKENIICLDDSLVSSHHAEILFEKKRLLLRDVGSTNGTWINGRRCEERILANSIRISFGSTEIMVTIPWDKSVWDRS